MKKSDLPPKNVYLDSLLKEQIIDEYSRGSKEEKLKVIGKMAERNSDEDFFPLELISLILKEEDPSIRMYFASRWNGNSNDEKVDFDVLKNDKNILVRCAMYANPEFINGKWIMGDDQQELFNGMSHLGKLAFLRNPELDEDVFDTIFDGSKREYKNDEKKHLELCMAALDVPERFAEAEWIGPISNDSATAHYHFCRVVWENLPKIKHGIVVRYITNNIPLYGSEVAANLYDEYAKDDPYMRRMIIFASKDDKLIAKGMSDEKSGVRAAAYAKASPRADEYNFSEEVQLKIVKEGTDEEKEGLALNEYVDRKILNLLADDKDDFVSTRAIVQRRARREEGTTDIFELPEGASIDDKLELLDSKINDLKEMFENIGQVSNNSGALLLSWIIFAGIIIWLVFR